MSKSVIIIPSRLASTRLPKKPLIKINNKSLIMHVYEKAIKSQLEKFMLQLVMKLLWR